MENYQEITHIKQHYEKAHEEYPISHAYIRLSLIRKISMDYLFIGQSTTLEDEVKDLINPGVVITQQFKGKDLRNPGGVITREFNLLIHWLLVKYMKWMTSKGVFIFTKILLTMDRLLTCVLINLNFNKSDYLKSHRIFSTLLPQILTVTENILLFMLQNLIIICKFHHTNPSMISNEFHLFCGLVGSWNTRGVIFDNILLPNYVYDQLKNSLRITPLSQL